jgi:hypothetical protein
LSNDWINRLIVRGPAKDVEAFAKAATDPRILKHQLEKPSNRGPQRGLSFDALLSGLPPSWATPLNREVTNPWDLSVDRPVRLKRGLIERTYRFQLRHYEPDTLLIKVSKQYARLCFVLGWVDPNSDDQASRFIHSGRSVLYRLPERRKRVLHARVPEEGTADASEIFWALAAADWAMMDAVVAHWDKRVASVLRRVTRAAAKSRGGTKGSRRGPSQAHE